MKTIVEEKLVSFKTLEQKIFAYVCELGCEITKIILEYYDDELAASRDTKQYRDKGGRKTSIKTVYGEVEYWRRVYRTTLDNGEHAHVYLLVQAMQMDKIGLISTNLAEKIAMTVTDSPYRVTVLVLRRQEQNFRLIFLRRLGWRYPFRGYACEGYDCFHKAIVLEIRYGLL